MEISCFLAQLCLFDVFYIIYDTQMVLETCFYLFSISDCPSYMFVCVWGGCLPSNNRGSRFHTKSIQGWQLASIMSGPVGLVFFSEVHERHCTCLWTINYYNQPNNQTISNSEYVFVRFRILHGVSHNGDKSILFYYCIMDIILFRKFVLFSVAMDFMQ